MTEKQVLTIIDIVCFLIQATLIVLKLLHIINWSWWLIFIPLEIFIGIIALIFLIIGIIFIVSMIKG